MKKIGPWFRVISFLFVCGGFWGLCAKSAAALDAELNSPYQLRVVLQVAENRSLTLPFQKQIESELRAQLQLTLGKLAQVEVVRSHPLLNDIRNKGLQAVLDTWDEVSSAQTHFVLIDFVDGQYRIKTGHHDGMTGLSSTVVRCEMLGDRGRVPDAAGEMVRKEFAVVGTLQRLEGKEIKVAIKGGGLVGSLGPWVQQGDAFAVVRIGEQAGKMRASALEWAVLQAVEILPQGYVRCRYFCRYQEDRVLPEGGPAAGYRCVQLKTGRGPVRVRLVNEKTHEFLSGLRVIVSDNDDFKGDLAQGITIKGLFEAEGPFHQVAYVRVLSGDIELAEFPVPLVDDRTVVCRMSPNEAAMRQGELERRKAQWIRWQVEALALADKRLTEFNAALTPSALEDALRLGRKHLEALEAEAARLATEGARLQQLAGTEKIKLDLSAGLRFADALAKRQLQLTKYLDDLDKLIKEANSDQTRELIATVKRAEILEKQAEFEKAIELYESVLKIRAGDEVKAHLQELKAAWAIRSEDHAKARQFFYTNWPAFDLTAVAANLTKAKACFQTCQKAGDHLTAVKVVLVNVQHLQGLAKELEVLRKSRENLDNPDRLKTMLELARNLPAWQVNVEAWVAKDKNAGK